MKAHTKLYLKAFGYSEEDYIPCEITGLKAIDIHHIDSRGMGGDPNNSKNRIENLMAVTREMHIKYGDKAQFMSELYRIHRDKMDDLGVEYDHEFINERIEFHKSLNQG